MRSVGIDDLALPRAAAALHDGACYTIVHVYCGNYVLMDVLNVTDSNYLNFCLFWYRMKLIVFNCAAIMSKTKLSS